MKCITGFLIGICSFLFVLPTQMMAQFPLYEGPIPGALPVIDREKTAINDWGVEFTTETTVPTLTAFQPAQPNGTAIIICPGGGYWGTAGDHEGRQVAKALNEAGITAFVLKYRVPDPNSASVPHLVPLQDVRQAIRLVRRSAHTWGIRPDRIGILGFSAGGHLAASLAAHWEQAIEPRARDSISLRPDFVALIYPVISFDPAMAHLGSRDKLLGADPPPTLMAYFSLEKQVKPGDPPAFLIHAQDDEAVPVTNSLAYYNACLKAGVPAEMHLYPTGGHGFGLAKNNWLFLLTAWLAKQ